MDELSEIKRKKMLQMQQNYQDQLEDQAELHQQVQQLEVIVKQRLTKEALERYSNIKAADPEKAVQILAILAQFISRSREQITDEQFKRLLLKITPEKKEFRITRK
jgi:programmed cell death protein 5